MGGMPPLGYEATDRKLVVIPAEADMVRQILRSATRAWRRVVHGAIADLVSRSDQPLALDVGAGSGRDAAWLARLGLRSVATPSGPRPSLTQLAALKLRLTGFTIQSPPR